MAGTKTEQGGWLARARNKARVLAALPEHLTITATAGVLGLKRRQVQRWMAADPVFREAVYTAQDAAKERLETSMYQRAMKGDTIAGIFMLKGLAPRKYRDQIAPPAPERPPVLVFIGSPAELAAAPPVEMKALPGQVEIEATAELREQDE